MEMDYARIISSMFHDKPGVMYENPPPPDDYVDDFEPIFFTYPRPQRVILPDEMRFIKIDRSLLHKNFRGIVEKEQKQTSSESPRETEKRAIIENGGSIRSVKTEKPSAEVSVKETVVEKKISPKKKKDIQHEDRSEGEISDVDSDDSRDGRKKKTTSSKSTALQTILKSYSVSDSDSSDSEKHRTKSSSHHSKSHSKKSSRHRKKDKHSRKDASFDDVIPYDKVGSRSAKFSVKQETISTDEESFSASFSKKAEIVVKEEVLSDKDDYRKEKRKKSKSSKKKHKESRSHDDSRSPLDNSWCPDNARNVEEERIRSSYSKKAEITVKGEDLSDEDNYRQVKVKSSKSSKKKYDPRDNGGLRNSDDSRSCDDSRSRFVESRSRDDPRTYDDSRKSYSDYSSGDDSRNIGNEGSKVCSRNSDSYMQREIKQEIKQEPGSTIAYGPNDYYCDICKLILNSETTFSSHMAGKRHKKALRQLSEQEVARSSVLEITESQNFPRPPDMDRIEIFEESKIQVTCETADLLIVGLDYVHEIRGYDDTKYFCELCSAQCVANSIIKHLIGFKHQMNCLKTYCYRSYNWVKDLDKRDRRVDRELKSQLEDVRRLNGTGRIKVFRDVKRSQRSPEPFKPYQPSTSRQNLLPPKDVSGKKSDEPKITDEECLSRDYSDFYCKVCDSHMNNFSMWESHVRGKRHAKAKKKAEEGAVPNPNVIEAPPGTVSHLEEMILEDCGPNDIIVGLNFIRENQGENGDLYNCYLCGSVCPTIDIIDHLYLKKHKTKYLEKMNADGYQNAINEINSLPIGENAREGLVDDECEKLMLELGRGRPVVVAKKIF